MFHGGLTMDDFFLGRTLIWKIQASNSWRKKHTDILDKMLEWKWKSPSHVWLCNSTDYSLWNSLGQNTGVGSFSLLQGIFPIEWSNPGLPHCRWIPYQLSYQEDEMPTSLKIWESIVVLKNRINCILHPVVLSQQSWWMSLNNSSKFSSKSSADTLLTWDLKNQQL